eukprot:4521943-Pyramimonas_sp.AAC.2
MRTEDGRGEDASRVVYLRHAPDEADMHSQPASQHTWHKQAAHSRVVKLPPCKPVRVRFLWASGKVPKGQQDEGEERQSVRSADPRRNPPHSLNTTGPRSHRVSRVRAPLCWTMAARPHLVVIPGLKVAQNARGFWGSHIL